MLICDFLRLKKPALRLPFAADGLGQLIDHRHDFFIVLFVGIAIDCA